MHCHYVLGCSHPCVWIAIKLPVVLCTVISSVTTDDLNHREMEMTRRDIQMEKEFKRCMLGESEMEKPKRNLNYLITTVSTTWSMEVPDNV